MSIHKYPSKKAKSGYLYFVKVYMTKDGQRADHVKRGFRTRKDAKDYEARLIYLKASGKLEEFIKPSQKSYSEIFEKKRKKIRTENYWTVQELQEFLNIVLQEEPYKHYALFRLLAYSGLRKGELYALKWADIDFQSEALSISKSLGRLDGQAVEKGTKNNFSVRKIKLDSETISILQEWKSNCQKEKAQLAVAPLSIEQDFIFTYCTRTGSIEPLHADYINNVLSRIIRKHGLRKISPHGFRHTHATLMIEIGVDPVNTAKRLGHASSQMTLDTYSHSTANGEDRSIKQFASYLKNNTKNSRQ